MPDIQNLFDYYNRDWFNNQNKGGIDLNQNYSFNGTNFVNDSGQFGSNFSLGNNSPLENNTYLQGSVGKINFNIQPPQGKFTFPSIQTKQASKFSKFMNGKNTKFGMQLASSALSAIPGLDRDVNSNDTTSRGVRDTLTQVGMSTGNPYIMAGALAYQGIDKLGGMSDASQGLGGITDAANMGASILLPGAGFFTGKTHNADWGDLNKVYALNSGYAGTQNNSRIAQQNSNAKILFGKGRANDKIDRAVVQGEQIQNITDKALIDKNAANINQVMMRTQMNRSGGMNFFAKNGMKLYDLSDVKRILQKGGSLSKERNLDELVKYANKVNPEFVKRLNEPTIRTVDRGNGTVSSHMLGYAEADGKTYVFPQVQEINGKLKYFSDWKEAFKTALKNKDVLEMTPSEAETFTTQYKTKYPGFKVFLHKTGGKFNVIPEGALHKNKHHLDEVDEKFDKVTTKGIPVITEKDGEVKQQAEVEKEEIIFRLDVTKQLEQLSKEGTDEAAIKAGKLLVKEILHNTKDNTNNLI